MELDTALEKNPHLREYLERISREGAAPSFVPSLSEDMAYLKRVNIIYPVGDPIFIHILSTDEGGREYRVVEPSLNKEEYSRLDRIKERILELAPTHTPDEEAPEEMEKRIGELFESVTYTKESRQSFLDRIRGKGIPVGSAERGRMLYKLRRDLVRGGLIEPLLRTLTSRISTPWD